MNKSRMTLIIGILCLLLALACTGQAIAWVVANRRTGVDDMAVYLTMPRGVFATSTPAPATLSSSVMDQYDFAAKVGIDSDRILNPISTPNATDWYVPNDVLSDGSANTSHPDEWFLMLDEEQADEYIINQTFYMVNTYTEDVTLKLSNVTITRGSKMGTDSNLYRAVRVAVTYNGTTTTYRVVENNQNFGAAQPASGIGSVCTDFSIPAGNQVPATVQVLLPAAEAGETGSTGNMTLTTAMVTVKVWIEGQNDYAVREQAGYAFRVSLTFSE